VEADHGPRNTEHGTQSGSPHDGERTEYEAYRKADAGCDGYQPLLPVIPLVPVTLWCAGWTACPAERVHSYSLPITAPIFTANRQRWSSCSKSDRSPTNGVKEKARAATRGQTAMCRRLGPTLVKCRAAGGG
jgi:hypothetical protein